MQVLKVSYTSPTAAQDFIKSMRETGFAVLTDHPVPSNLMYETYAEWEGFFQGKEKFEHTFDPNNTKGNCGYFPFKSENAKGYSAKDLKEFYHYYPWDGLPTVVSDKTHTLFTIMEKLGLELLSWMEEALPQEIRATFDRPLSDVVKDAPATLVRVLHYPPLTGIEEEGEVRAHAHGDINFITLLPAATEPGLQVQDVKGNWHDVPCDPGSIAVNGADMLEMLTNGYYPSTQHRVVNPVGEEARKSRYSMPFFLHGHKEVRLSDKHTVDSYFAERMAEIGLGAKDAA